VNFVLTTNHPCGDTASLPEYVTTWCEDELRGAVMGLQWLNWRYMPRSVFDEEDHIWTQALGALLPLFYPDAVRPATAGEHATGAGLLRLDPAIEWNACLERDHLRLPRAACVALGRGLGRSEHKRDLMLRHRYEVAVRQFEQDQRLASQLFLTQMAQALFQGEVGIGHILYSASDNHLAYRIRDYYYGSDRLFDGRAVEDLRQSISRLETEGNSELLRRLRQVMKRHYQAFVAAGELSKEQRICWQGHYDELLQQIQTALANIRRHDTAAIAALAERCYQHGQNRLPVMAQPLSPGFGFFGELLQQGLSREHCEMLWWLAVKSIAAEMEVDSWIAAFSLCGAGGDLARALFNALLAGTPPVLAWARLLYMRQKSHVLRANLLDLAAIEDAGAHTLQNLREPAEKVIARNEMSLYLTTLTPIIFAGESA
jgi:hypothetical protein